MDLGGVDITEFDELLKLRLKPLVELATQVAQLNTNFELLQQSLAKGSVTPSSATIGFDDFSDVTKRMSHKFEEMARQEPDEPGLETVGLRHSEGLLHEKRKQEPQHFRMQAPPQHTRSE